MCFPVQLFKKNQGQARTLHTSNCTNQRSWVGSFQVLVFLVCQARFFSCTFDRKNLVWKIRSCRSNKIHVDRILPKVARTRVAGKILVVLPSWLIRIILDTLVWFFMPGWSCLVLSVLVIWSDPCASNARSSSILRVISFIAFYFVFIVVKEYIKRKQLNNKKTFRVQIKKTLVNNVQSRKVENETAQVNIKYYLHRIREHVQMSDHLLSSSWLSGIDSRTFPTNLSCAHHASFAAASFWSNFRQRRLVQHVVGVFEQLYLDRGLLSTKGLIRLLVILPSNISESPGPRQLNDAVSPYAVRTKALVVALKQWMNECRWALTYIYISAQRHHVMFFLTTRSGSCSFSTKRTLSEVHDQ